MIKAILFDFDGVLFDTETYDNKLLRDYLISIHSPIPGERMKLLICSDKTKDIFDDVIAGYEDQVDKESFKKGLIADISEKRKHLPFADLVFEDTERCVKWMKEQGYSIACASSSSLDYVQRGLKEGKVAQYFDLMVSGDDFTRSKPDPDIYLYCADKLQVKPEECLVVEDSPNGIASGKAAGMHVVVRRDHFLGLNQEGGDDYIDTFDELPAILKRL